MNIVKAIISIIITILLCSFANAQTKTNIKMKEQANIIFTAWEKGEAGNGYADFKNHIDESNFKTFSHPLKGNYTNKEALQKLVEIIKEREVNPNQLQFSNVITYSFQNNFCFQFDSEGKVSGGFPYKGYNIIQLEIKGAKLVGFREYFGFIDPAWFK